MTRNKNFVMEQNMEKRQKYDETMEKKKDIAIFTF